jgi:hypothetical protein
MDAIRASLQRHAKSVPKKPVVKKARAPAKKRKTG